MSKLSSYEEYSTKSKAIRSETINHDTEDIFQCPVFYSAHASEHLLFVRLSFRELKGVRKYLIHAYSGLSPGERKQIYACCCRLVAKSCPTLCDPMDCSSPGSPVLHHLPSSTFWVRSNSYPLSQWCYLTISSSAALFSSCLQSFPVSGSYSNKSALRIRLSKYWSFSFSICPSNEYSGLISFSISWFDLLAVQGILKSLLQHRNLKASILPALSLLHGPNPTSVHDYWKNHCYDYTDLRWLMYMYMCCVCKLSCFSWCSGL